MASSRKRRRSDLADSVAAELARHVPRGATLTLALSGGVDSIAALDILAGRARAHPFALDCLHVNHRISPNAGAWARFCARRGAAVRPEVHRADGRPRAVPPARRGGCGAGGAVRGVRPGARRLRRAGAPPRRPGRNGAAAARAGRGRRRPRGHARRRARAVVRSCCARCSASRGRRSSATRVTTLWRGSKTNPTPTSDMPATSCVGG